MDEGRIARVDPVHLIFSIWALTQHYADFDVQVRAVLGPGTTPLPRRDGFWTRCFTRLADAGSGKVLGNIMADKTLLLR